MTTSLSGTVCHPVMTKLHTEFEVSSLSHSRDILVGLKKINGSRDMTTPLSGTVRHP